MQGDWGEKMSSIFKFNLRAKRTSNEGVRHVKSKFDILKSCWQEKARFGFHSEVVDKVVVIFKKKKNRHYELRGQVDLS